MSRVLQWRVCALTRAQAAIHDALASVASAWLGSVPPCFFLPQTLRSAAASNPSNETKGR